MELRGGSRHYHVDGSLAGPLPASFTPVTVNSTVTSAGRFSKVCWVLWVLSSFAARRRCR
jgi:hypothetical protein